MDNLITDPSSIASALRQQLETADWTALSAADTACEHQIEAPLESIVTTLTPVVEQMLAEQRPLCTICVDVEHSRTPQTAKACGFHYASAVQAHSDAEHRADQAERRLRETERALEGFRAWLRVGSTAWEQGEVYGANEMLAKILAEFDRRFGRTP